MKSVLFVVTFPLLLIGDVLLENEFYLVDPQAKAFDVITKVTKLPPGKDSKGRPVATANAIIACTKAEKAPGSCKITLQ